MRLWTLQPENVYEQLKVKQVHSCNPSMSKLVTELGFRPAYDWMADQMTKRIGPAPTNVSYPIWAWHTIDGKHKKPDLRRSEFRNCIGHYVCLELEVPNQEVLLSDEEMWHFVLNNGYYGDAHSDTEYEMECARLESLSESERIAAIQKSWERIFDVSPYEDEWERRGRYIQATFWEIRLEQVLSVCHYKGRFR